MKPIYFFLISRAANVFGLQIAGCTLIFRAVSGGAGPYGLSQLGLTATLGSLIFAIPTGFIVDHLKKSTSILLSHGILFALALSLTVQDPQSFSHILIAAGALAVSRNFRSISQFTVYGELLQTQKQKNRWINLSTLSWQGAAFLSPLLAGILGAGRISLLVASVFFAVSLACQLFILPALSFTAKPAQPRVLELSGFFRFVSGNFKLYSSLLLDFVVVLFAGVSSLVPFLHDGFSSPLNIGLLRSALPAGVILGTLLRLNRVSLEGWARKLTLATLGYGLCHLLLAEFQTLFLSFLFLFGAGMFDAVSLSVRECILQLETPAALKGRVYSLNNFLVNASDELSEWESGLASQRFGVQTAIRLSGMVALMASSLFTVSAQLETNNKPGVVNVPINR
jgi:hypothetical protein